MRFRFILVTCFILFSCSILLAQPNRMTSAINSGTLQPFGLEGKVVTTITAEVQEHPFFTNYPTLIFAGTTEDGVFQVSLNDTSHQWVSLGLAGKSITALTVQHWGVGPADGLKLYAAVIRNSQQSNTTLIYRREVGIPIDTMWSSFENGLDRSKLKRVNALNSYYFTGHTPPQPLVMGGENGLYQATFGNIWREAEFEGIVKIHALDVRPHWFGNLAWAVGSDGLSPAAFRSTDKGNSWTTFPLPSFMEGGAFSLTINPRHPDTVYVGHMGAVFITPDSGKTWQLSGLEVPSVKFSALAVDPFAPENVFAGGVSGTNSFTFYHSSDGGTTWIQIHPSTEQEIAGVTSIAVLDSGSTRRQTFVFIGTEGSGVWLYKPSIITDIQNKKQIPDRFVLYRNYPNPFNPETTIEYELAESGHALLSIFNLLGQRVQTLVDAWQPAGIYKVNWGGREEKSRLRVASGVYIYELNVENSVIRKKMILLQ